MFPGKNKSFDRLLKSWRLIIDSFGMEVDKPSAMCGGLTFRIFLSKISGRVALGRGVRCVVFMLCLFVGGDVLAEEGVTSVDAARRLRGVGDASSGRASLDLPNLSGKTVLEAKLEIGNFLKNFIVVGDPRNVLHVMTYARMGSDVELVPSIRQRLLKTGDGWTEEHVKVGAMHALAVLAGEKFPEQISQLLKSDDVTLRARAFMLARDTADKRLTEDVEEALADEQDASVKASGLAALLVLNPEDSLAKSQLRGLAIQQNQAGERARVELIKSGMDPPENQVLSREEEERDKEMILSDRHDARMAAIEEIGHRGSPGARGWLRRLGSQENWHHRMSSAYYLLISGENEEALRRLQAEKEPLVQITLLAALRAPSKESAK